MQAMTADANMTRGFVAVMAVIAVLLVLLAAAMLILKKIHAVTLDRLKLRHKAIIAAVVLFTMLCAALPMNLSPSFNGTNPAHRNQYEETAEAFLNGHLYLDEEPDPRLAELDDPYDFYQRRDAGISYAWDHSYYNGHYYMYFGVVPVILLFLPFRAITGATLLTYHATAIFTVLFVIGLFALLYRLARYFFSDLSLPAYLLLGVAFSALSVWYVTEAPALYCTAIVAAMCMAVWSLFFFVRAVWGDDEEKTAICCAFFGSLFGVLEIGCRPTIAASNLIVLALLVVFILKRGWHKGMLPRLVIAALPYLVIGGLLMLYNYLRFDNPLEFGQSYQLTAVNMSGGSMISRYDLPKFLSAVHYYLLGMENHEDIVTWGIFITFPILLLGFAGLADVNVRGELRRNHLELPLAFGWLSFLVILSADILFSELLVPRYRLDLYWLAAILAFIVIGLWYHVSWRKIAFSKVLCVLAIFTVWMSIILFITPHDENFTCFLFDPNPQTMREMIRNTLSVG